METRKRTLIKSVSWRVWATFITFMVAYYITGSIEFAVEIGMFEVVLKMTGYYLHERFWVNIKYGKR